MSARRVLLGAALTLVAVESWAAWNRPAHPARVLLTQKDPRRRRQERQIAYLEQLPRRICAFDGCGTNLWHGARAGGLCRMHANIRTGARRRSAPKSRVVRPLLLGFGFSGEPLRFRQLRSKVGPVGAKLQVQAEDALASFRSC